MLNFQKIDKWIGKIQDFLLTFFLILMIVLAFLQVILRNFFQTGLTWADPIVRHLVLWLGFIGAMVATKDRGHLSMDLVSKFLPDSFKRISDRLILIFSSGVCFLLAYASFKFVLDERTSGSLLLPGVPNYWGVIIIPIAFALMSLRFLIQAIFDFCRVRSE